MKKLLFIDAEQYGYHTDVFKYCQYLKDYDITLICYDWGLEKFRHGKHIHVVYVRRYNQGKIRLFLFLVTCLYILYTRKFDFRFVCFFPHCELLKSLFHGEMHLDIRTLGITNSKEWRDDWDRKVNKCLPRFDSVSTISNGVAHKLGLKSYFLLPLGADIISKSNKSFNDIRLLYIGTFSFRNIYHTIEGLGVFIKRMNWKIPIRYDIIGYGESSDMKLLKDAIRKYSLENIVVIHGRKRYDELKEFLDDSNVGVSYVPITDYYDAQPPTKTFEYILSGLFCIGTGTSSNKEVISSENGIIIDDNKESFAEALNYIWENKGQFDSDCIRKTLLNYQWLNIVENYLKPIIEKNYEKKISL